MDSLWKGEMKLKFEWSDVHSLHDQKIILNNIKH
jgi:hypothetical protein